MLEQTHHSHTHNSVEFQVLCQTNFGEEVKICGNAIQLGNWNPLLAHRLVTDASIYPKWKSCVPLIIMNSNKIQFKACIVANNRVLWQRNVQNRQISSLTPSIIQFTFNQPDEKVIEKKITQIDCREGTWQIVQEMQGSESSSIVFKSNYPIQNYFQYSDQDSLQRSRGLSFSQLSSNLFSPNGCGRSQQGQSIGQFEQIAAKYIRTPELIKSQSIKPQLVRKYDQNRLSIHAKNLDPDRNRSRSRSVQRSDSGSQNKSDEPISPYMIHVPSYNDVEKRIKSKNATKKPSIYASHGKPSGVIHKNTECSSTNELSEQNKSTSTVIEYDTEDEYFTTRELDVAIQNISPEFNDYV